MTAIRPPAGIVCPLATPLRSDGSLNEPVLRALIDGLVPDLDGVFVLGSSGELPWLPDDVAADVARIAVEHVAGRIPVYVGVGDTGLRRTLDRVARFGDLGADGLVAATPYYYAVESDAALVDHFTAIADASPVPVVLYNIPQSTHVVLTASVVRSLAAHPKIVGMKDSAGDWFAFEQFLALRDDGFSVLQGREQLAAVSLWSGADGVISAVANFAPRLLQALLAAIRLDRARSEGMALQRSITDLAAVFDEGHWLAGLKCTLEALGWDVGDPSQPIPPYDSRAAATVGAIVKDPDLGPWLTSAAAKSRPGTIARAGA